MSYGQTSPLPRQTSPPHRHVRPLGHVMPPLHTPALQLSKPQRGLVQNVPSGSTKFAGHAVLEPLHVSAGSHCVSPVPLARHTVPAG